MGRGGSGYGYWVTEPDIAPNGGSGNSRGGQDGGKSLRLK